MSFRRQKKEYPPFLDLTCASDIIFSLLLFFILTQNFISTLNLDLPSFHNNDSSAKSGIVFHISASGTLLLENSVIPANDWRKFIRAKVQRIGSNTPIIIEPHRDAPSGITLELLDEIRHCGCPGVVLRGALYQADKFDNQIEKNQ